jgi:hypothetical protein
MLSSAGRRDGLGEAGAFSRASVRAPQDGFTVGKDGVAAGRSRSAAVMMLS